MTVLEQSRARPAQPSDPSWLAPATDPARHHADPAHALTIELVEDRAGFEALKPDWDRLHAKASTIRRLPFQSHAWLSIWCETHLRQASSGPVRLAIAVVRQGRAVCLICPFAVEHVYGLKRLVWMGDPASQYGDVLLDHDRASSTEIAAAFRHVLDHVTPDIIRLRRVRADAAAAPFLRGEKAAIAATNQAPFIDLSKASTPDAYAARFSAKARKNRRRQRRRLEEKGTVSVTVLPPGPRAREALATALAFKQDWLIKRGEICSALRDPRTQALLQQAATAEAEGFTPYVSVMSCNDEPVSVQFGIVSANRLALHLIAYNPAWEKAAVGILHTEETITYGIENGLAELDFLGPDASYKREWSDDAVAINDFVLAPTISGKLYAETFLGRSRIRFKYVLEHLPRTVRCRIARRLELRAEREA